MFEALAGEVLRREISVLDHHHCIALLTDISGSRVIGALALNTLETDYTKAFVLFNSTNVILGTGGPAGIYETSVYPLSQRGSTGMAFMAGASGQNLTESQFGIASLKFRWNLSGSYQQAIPRYLSTDKQGKDEKEFLNDFFPDIRTLTKAVFLKGYQWPFDPGKISNYGSSLIDLLVYFEINKKNRNVYLDYTRNPSWKNGELFTLDNLDPEVDNYLRNSGALSGTPIERLRELNSPAIALYKEHGIDIGNEYLQIAVCVQHNNGGLKGNIWWESDLRHLFPVGEVNGSHGVNRPGGSALNSGQVGSFRAAQFISKKYHMPPLNYSEFLTETKEKIMGMLSLADGWMLSRNSDDNKKYYSEIRIRMSEYGGIIRDTRKIAKASTEAAEMLIHLPDKIGAGSVGELVDSFLLLDHCLTQYVYLETIKYYIDNGGRSRGSYLVTNIIRPVGSVQNSLDFDSELCLYDKDIEQKIVEVCFRDGILKFKQEEVRRIPEQNLWFEKVWKDYIEDNYLDC
jgi:succinate dehydrogenase/fumarate reductase flavoprotein subunit